MNREIISLIDKNDGNSFLKYIISIKLSDLVNVNFDLIDNYLMKSKSFPLLSKIVYARSFSRPIYNKLIEEVILNKNVLSSDVLLYVAGCEKYFSNDIIDSLIIRNYDVTEKKALIKKLKEYNLYDSYLENLKNGRDSCSKIRFALNFGFLENLYPDNLKLAQIIVNLNEYDSGICSRSEDLYLLSMLTKDSNTLKYIESVMPIVVAEENKKMNSYLSKNNEKNKGIKNKLSLCFRRFKKINYNNRKI